MSAAATAAAGAHEVPLTKTFHPPPVDQRSDETNGTRLPEGRISEQGIFGDDSVSHGRGHRLW